VTFTFMGKTFNPVTGTWSVAAPIPAPTPVPTPTPTPAPVVAAPTAAPVTGMLGSGLTPTIDIAGLIQGKVFNPATGRFEAPATPVSATPVATPAVTPSVPIPEPAPTVAPTIAPTTAAPVSVAPTTTAVPAPLTGYAAAVANPPSVANVDALKSALSIPIQGGAFDNFGALIQKNTGIASSGYTPVQLQGASFGVDKFATPANIATNIKEVAQYLFQNGAVGSDGNPLSVAELQKGLQGVGYTAYLPTAKYADMPKPYLSPEQAARARDAWNPSSGGILDNIAGFLGDTGIGTIASLASLAIPGLQPIAAGLNVAGGVANGNLGQVASGLLAIPDVAKTVLAPLSQTLGGVTRLTGNDLAALTKGVTSAGIAGLSGADLGQALTSGVASGLGSEAGSAVKDLLPASVTGSQTLSNIAQQMANTGVSTAIKGGDVGTALLSAGLGGLASGALQGLTDTTPAPVPPTPATPEPPQPELPTWLQNTTPVTEETTPPVELPENVFYGPDNELLIDAGTDNFVPDWTPPDTALPPTVDTTVKAPPVQTPDFSNLPENVFYGPDNEVMLDAGTDTLTPEVAPPTQSGDNSVVPAWTPPSTTLPASEPAPENTGENNMGLLDDNAFYGPDGEIMWDAGTTPDFGNLPENAFYGPDGEIMLDAGTGDVGSFPQQYTGEPGNSGFTDPANALNLHTATGSTASNASPLQKIMQALLGSNAPSNSTMNSLVKLLGTLAAHRGTINNATSAKNALANQHSSVFSSGLTPSGFATPSSPSGFASPGRGKTLSQVRMAVGGAVPVPNTVGNSPNLPQRPNFVGATGSGPLNMIAQHATPIRAPTFGGNELMRQRLLNLSVPSVINARQSPLPGQSLSSNVQRPAGVLPAGVTLAQQQPAAQQAAIAAMLATRGNPLPANPAYTKATQPVQTSTVPFNASMPSASSAVPGGLASLIGPSVGRRYSVGGSLGGNSYSDTVIGLLRGGSSGQADDVPIHASHGEYVMDADTVSALGDGNNEAGASALDQMRINLRKHKRSAPATSIPPKAKSPEQYLKGRK